MDAVYGGLWIYFEVILQLDYDPRSQMVWLRCPNGAIVHSNVNKSFNC